MVPVEIAVKLKKRLEMMRVAGAIADYRITQSSGRALIEIQPGDSLEGEELQDFSAEMMGNDLERDQIIVVAAIK
jgi:hypothetical protein